MPEKAQSVASPTRLPPAPTAPDSRHGTSMKSPTSLREAALTLVPLSPPGRVKQQRQKPRDMPLSSAVLLATRSPPQSPLSREQAELEQYALRLYQQKRAPTDAVVKPSPQRSLAANAPARRMIKRMPPASRLPATNNNIVDQQQTRVAKLKRPRDADADADGRHLDAGVYVVESRLTSHHFFGTTWDLRNASAQCVVDLRDGVHPHAGLVASYREDAASVVFRVLERVVPPPAAPEADPQRRRRPRRQHDPDFDVHSMEELLQRRLAFHQRKITRQVALRLVRARIVAPYLAQYWPRWTATTATHREDERLAAAVVIQSAMRCRLGRLAVATRRRHRAALCIARFMALEAMKRVLHKRRLRKRRHESATKIQRCGRQFLQRRRQEKRATLIKKWLSARSIQRVYRGHQCRSHVRTLRTAKQSQAAAMRIQALVRGFLARRRTTTMRYRADLHQRATKIQARWRGVFVRQCVYAPRCRERQVTEIQHAAARRLQAFYWRCCVHHKLTNAAELYAVQAKHATRIHAAYKNYVAKKFGWAAVTFKLEHTSATKIQRSMRSRFFFRRLKRLVEARRREQAALTIERAFRGLCGRRKARDRRAFVTRDRAVRRLQRAWRLSQGLTKLHVAVQLWKRDKSARLIQARYRGFHRRRAYLVCRTRIRRERAATKIQSAFRRRCARMEWKRRLQLQRDGVACQACGGNRVAVFYWSMGLELCAQCTSKWRLDSGDLIEVAVYRHQRRLASQAQRVYRGFQVRMALRFGTCGFCEQRALRIVCRSCSGKGQTFCHSCDALFHRTTLGRPHTDRLRIEAFYRQHEAAILLQKHMRRYVYRHTLAERRYRRQSQAAVKIQTLYTSRQRRRHTRALVAAQKQLLLKHDQAARAIQRHVRGFLARRERDRLRTRMQSAITLQRVFRGHRGREKAREQRRRRDAAVCIQRHLRGMRGRQLADVKREEAIERRRNRAAVTLQRRLRGWLVRRRLWHQKRWLSAVRIQSAWRQRVARQTVDQLVQERDRRTRLEAEAREKERQARQFEKERQAVVRIQSQVRRRIAQQQLVRLRLERARQRRLDQLRVWLLVEQKSAVRIQRFVRKKWLIRATTASLKLQRIARQWLARRELKRLRVTKQAVVCIQRAFRYSRVKRKLSKLVSMESKAVAGSISGWVEMFDEESGCVYYYNRLTMESTWVKPPEMMGDAPEQLVEQKATEEDEPPEWVEYWDENVGASYYYSTRTGEATWATPEGMSSNQTEGAEWPSAWPPGAPFDAKDKVAAGVGALDNQAETETQDPAAMDPAGGYYVDAEGNAYAVYDYQYGYYAYGYGYGGDEQDASYAAYSYAPSQTGEGFDDTPVDTEYDINYQIYMTQLQREHAEDHTQEE